jgi:hypothetical protein
MDPGGKCINLQKWDNQVYYLMLFSIRMKLELAQAQEAKTDYYAKYTE